uniref:RHS repeat domain-containing protein n=1 Tax=Ralstonia wenshanensis TaxID=2842456 RepID=UPI0028C3D74F|nr:RHS repeat domain-containing protein [Ralstonia wenshanensis]
MSPKKTMFGDGMKQAFGRRLQANARCRVYGWGVLAGIVSLAVVLVLVSGHALASDPPASAIGHQWQSGYCLKDSAVEAIVCNASTQGAVSADSCSWDGWYLWCTARFPSGAPYGNVPAWPISSCAPGYTWQQVDGTCKSPPLPTPVQACAVGHPVIPGTGVKILIERGDAGNAELPITFAYRSQGVFGSAGGAGQWTLNWLRSLDTGLVGYAPPQVTALRDDGAGFAFGKATSGWTASGSRDTLQPVTDATGKFTAWQYTVSGTNAVETYDSKGRLQSVRERNGRMTTLTYNAQSQLTKVTAPSGRSLTFAYDTQGRVSSITAPDGAITQYAYNANGMLTTVTWPDNTTRQYVYEDTRFPTALTGVIDEAGVRYATYAYDDQGRAITSELTAGADRYQFQYQANGQTTVLTPDGGSSVYSFLKQNGVLLPTGVSAPCPTCGNTALSTSYDSNNNATSKTGYDGSTTSYTYDTLGRETQRIEGAGTANAKTTTTEWDPQQWLVTRVAAPNKIEAFSYDANGNLLSHTVTPTGDANGSLGFGGAASGPVQRTDWTYDDSGHVLTATERTDGAVTGTWTLTYDTQGNLQTLTNPDGKTGRITLYDAAGRVLEAVDVNGSTIKLSYNARGWLTTYDVGGQQIRFEYDAVGQRTAMLGPDDSAMRIVYDSAHRITEILANLSLPETTVQPSSATSLSANQVQQKAGPPPFLQTVKATAVHAWNVMLKWVREWLSSLIQSAHAQVPPAMSSVYQALPPVSSGAPNYNRPPFPGDVVDLNARDHVRPDLRTAVINLMKRIGNAICRGGETSREECKQEAVAQYEEDAKNCSVAKIFWGSAGYRECMKRAGDLLVERMKQCDGK